MHDSLTGLFNRHFFENELSKLSDSTCHGQGPHSLLYLDLDHFKIINDTVGHHQGDIVLRNLSSLINAKIRSTDFLARIGGDEFAILLPLTNQQSAVALAKNICKQLDNYPCKIDGQIFKISCSIGITEISGGLTDDEYMRQADIALYAAKKQGRNMAKLYSEDELSGNNLQDSLRWMRTIRQTIMDNNLHLYFQPIIEISTKKIAYYEALVRLKIDGKIVLPEKFIPPLEREGDMILLDRQVVTKAISYLANHPKLHRISINLSAQGFSDERLLPLIKKTIHHFDVDPKRIIFELTESASLHNIAITQRIVDGLAEIGCAFSIDDFGTGFSTFTYLKKLPAESVKIDGSFIVDLDKNTTDYALVKAIYDVATALGKKTVAEFVESEQILIILAELGVTYAQGYHLGKPQPIEELIRECELNL
jgi:diguanylate cyclase (GGDEF)-like protein